MSTRFVIEVVVSECRILEHEPLSHAYACIEVGCLDPVTCVQHLRISGPSDFGHAYLGVPHRTYQYLGCLVARFHGQLGSLLRTITYYLYISNPHLSYYTISPRFGLPTPNDTLPFSSTQLA